MKTSLLCLVALMLVAHPLAAAPELVGHWDFDRITEGRVADLSGHGRHGRIHGRVESVPGVSGTGLRFKTNDDYVDFGAPVIPARDFTIGLWINCDDTVKQFFLGQYRYGHPQRLDLAVREGSVRIQLDIIVDSPKVIQPGRWYHLVYIRVGRVLKIYVDGERITTADLPGEVIQSENLLLGKIVVPKQDSFRFTGVIDELKIWNGALPEPAVRSEHAAGRAALDVPESRR